MNNFDIDLNDLYIGYLNDSGLMRMETDKGYTKHFEYLADEYGENGKWSLVAIEEDGIIYGLTDIPNFSRYKANLETGTIYSLVSDKWLNAKTQNYYGYIYSSYISDNNERVAQSVHAMIMSAYRQEEPKEWIKQGLEIDHLSGQKNVNSIDNLRLVTREQQYDSRVRATMGQGTPLTKDEVQSIRYIVEVVKTKGRQADSKLIHLLAQQYDKKYETIRKVVNNVTHKQIDLTEQMKNEIRQMQLKVILDELELSA